MGGPVVGRPFGVPVVVHPTWLIAFAVVSWSVAAGYLPAAYPHWSLWQFWAAGAIAAVLLFASVVAHELGHAALARARGLRVERITLFVFGGMAGIAGEAKRPLDDFVIALAGPLVSLAIAGSSWAAVPLAAGLGEAPGAVLAYLALVNLMLAAFNLVPGLPLDGGRALRAAAWHLTGSFTRATSIAGYLGQGFGYLLIAAGFLRMLGGDVIGGLWTTTIGWFLCNAAEASRREAERAAAGTGVLVGQLAAADAPFLPPTAMLETFVYDDVIQRGQRAVPVVDRGRLVGMVSVTDAGKVAPAAWCGTRVADVMTRDDLAVAHADDDLAAAYRLMAERGVHQLPVVDADRRLRGMITRAHIVAWLARAEAARRGLPGDERPAVLDEDVPRAA